MIDGPLKIPEERKSTPEERAQKAKELGIDVYHLNGSMVTIDTNGSQKFTLEMGNFHGRLFDGTFEKDKSSKKIWEQFKNDHKELIENLHKMETEYGEIVKKCNTETDFNKRSKLIEESGNLFDKNRHYYEEVYIMLAKLGLSRDLMWR